ncbi:uncharacterized protein V6R79_020894 [Siganus canaliculatus]
MERERERERASVCQTSSSRRRPQEAAVLVLDIHHRDGSLCVDPESAACSLQPEACSRWQRSANRQKQAETGRNTQDAFHPPRRCRRLQQQQQQQHVEAGAASAAFHLELRAVKCRR